MTGQRRIYIPPNVEPFVYDEGNQKALVVQLNNHIHLAKACLCQSFIIDRFYIYADDKFIEHGDEVGGYNCKLTGQGDIRTMKDKPLGKVPGDIKIPSLRPIYIPITKDHFISRTLPAGACVKIENVQTLATAFAKIYALKSATEILQFSHSINTHLN